MIMVMMMMMKIVIMFRTITITKNDTDTDSDYDYNYDNENEQGTDENDSEINKEFMKRLIAIMTTRVQRLKHDNGTDNAMINIMIRQTQIPLFLNADGKADVFKLAMMRTR